MQAIAAMFQTQVDNIVNTIFKQIQQNPALQDLYSDSDPHGNAGPQGKPGLDSVNTKDRYYSGLLKTDKISYFNPSAKDIEPVIFISHYIYYQDIYTFINYLRDIVQLKSEPTVYVYTSACLKETALKQFIFKLMEFKKELLYNQTLENMWILMFIRCFKSCMAEAF